MVSDRDARELFHLVFLEWLLRATSPELYVLKGGVNLRFFHDSPRYSEDMDLDVERSKVAVGTLKKNGYKILGDAAFRRVLAARSIVELRVNDPDKAKHTETTQRFALTLVLESGQALPTKVEFSRRGIERSCVVTERIHPEVVRRHGRTAYQVPHYGGSAAVQQKVAALAGRPVTQARDLFDLYLLDSRGAALPAEVVAIDATLRERAIANAASLDYDDFRGQVLDYLDPDAAADFASEARFVAIRRDVIAMLETKP
jgi:predicted nucleotidyltransferase component of viral defense system